MVWFIFTVLFIFLGFAMHKLKWYFLISGYNTMSKESKAKVNTDKLGRLIGNYSYFLALLFFIVGILSWQNLDQFAMPFILLLVLSTLFIVIKSQKYNGNLYDESGKLRKGASKKAKIPLTITIVTLIGVSILLYFSLQPTNITLTDNTLKINGMYGETVAFESIEQVTLLNQLPEISMRTNGSAIGSRLKGHFKFKDGKKAKLFVDSSMPPFISFVSNDLRIIFNLDTKEETENLFEQLQSK